jgi:hypothetical protein
MSSHASDELNPTANANALKEYENAESAEIFMRGNRFSSTKIRVEVNMWWK